MMHPRTINIALSDLTTTTVSASWLSTNFGVHKTIVKVKSRADNWRWRDEVRYVVTHRPTGLALFDDFFRLRAARAFVERLEAAEVPVPWAEATATKGGKNSARHNLPKVHEVLAATEQYCLETWGYTQIRGK